MKVWIDGRVVNGPEALIPVDDHGLLYGDGVFEGIRIYAGRPFALERHLERLACSARAIALEVPGGVDRARSAALATSAALDEEEAYLRLIVTRGSGPLGIDAGSCASPRMICIGDRIQLYSADKLRHGLDMATASVRRPPSDVLDPRVKSLNYLNSVLARLEARRAGADEALVLNAAGAVAESAAANVFVVRRGALRTPPATDGALEGITRGTVLELASALGIDAGERTLGRADLLGADEVFLTGAATGIAPVGSLDGRAIGAECPGPITQKLALAFADHVRRLD